MGAARRVHVVVTGIPRQLRRIYPALHGEGDFRVAGFRHRQLFHLGDVFGSHRACHRIISCRQHNFIAIGPIDLGLKEQVRGKALGGVGINPVDPVADDEGGRCRFTLLVHNVQADEVRGEDVEQEDDFIAKPDVLRPLADVETNLGRSLAAVMAVDFQNPVLHAQSGKAGGKRVLVIKGNIRPTFPRLLPA